MNFHTSYLSFWTPAQFPAQKFDTKNALIATQLILQQNSENRDTTDFDGCGRLVVVVLWWCYHHNHHLHHSTTTRVVVVVK